MPNVIVVPHQAFVFSTVFRAGLKGAATDHKSILFNVNPTTGDVKRGTTNAHWYKLGLHHILSCPWTSEHNFSRHPDKVGCVNSLPLAANMVRTSSDVLLIVCAAAGAIRRPCRRANY